MVDANAVERAKAIKALKSRRRAVRVRAIEQLCRMFEPLVKSQAKVYRQSVIGAEREDLEQTARVGLLVACQTFNPRKGAFASHAMWCVRDALSKHIEGLGNPVRLPAWMIRRLPKLRRTIMILAHELLRPPLQAEIAARMKIPIHAVETLLAYEAGPIEYNDRTDAARPYRRTEI